MPEMTIAEAPTPLTPAEIDALLAQRPPEQRQSIEQHIEAVKQGRARLILGTSGNTEKRNG